MTDIMQTPFGRFSMRRWPSSADKSLRAWDAADELLLSHIHEKYQALSDRFPAILICNDAYGALTCALHKYGALSWSDSSLSHSAVIKNWADNDLPALPRCLDSISQPSERFDLVLIKIPKTNALLEDQLARIRPHLHPDSVIIAASMVRHLNKAAFGLFERYIGPVTTSLAVKKSRLVFSTLDCSLPVRDSPYPDKYTDKALDITLANHANVFCRDRVDLGARFFLGFCGYLPAADTIVDLACGNGILGIHVQNAQPNSQLHFVDESYMAIDSTRRNYASLVKHSSRKAHFSVANGLENFAALSVDLIICNPPFHDKHTITDDTARAFFRAAAVCLKPEGQLWVVANRHLAYKSDLKRHFKTCKVIATNPKFVLLQAHGKKTS